MVTRSARPTAALLAAALALGAPAALHAQDGIGLPIGARPQPVVIEDLDGNPVDLGQWVGKKPVLVEFWATWCPLCEALVPRLEAARRLAGDRLEILIIAVAVNQSPRGVRRHLARHPLPGRVLWDTDGRATRAFQAPTTSYVVVLDRTGRVVYTGVGGDQALERPVAAAVGAAR